MKTGISPKVVNTYINAGDVVSTLSATTLICDFSRTLPKEIGQSLRRYYEGRKSRKPELLMLGEKAPLILTDLLNIDRAFATKMFSPWIFLYIHSLLIDDTFDQEVDTEDAYLTLVSQIALDHALVLFSKSTLFSEKLLELFERFRRESFYAMAKEIALKTAVGKSTDWRVFLRPGRKLAVAKFLASVLQQEARGRELESLEIDGLEDLFSGIQILDDVADYQEDFRAGRPNYLLNKASILKGSKAPALSPALRKWFGSGNSLEEWLASSGALNKAWRDAGRALSRGIKKLEARQGTEYFVYFSKLIASCEEHDKKLEKWIIAGSIMRNEHTYASTTATKTQTYDKWQQAGRLDDLLNVFSTGPRARN